MGGLIEGGAMVFQPLALLFMFAGVTIGIILGILPGISGGTAIILILPFLFGRDPGLMLPFLAAMFAVSSTGGSILSIVTGIPGDASNAATVIDGFPMTRKGEGGRAIGAAITSSAVGGVLAIVFALFMLPVIKIVVMNFRTPEMLLLIVLGLTFIAVVAHGSKIKGFISAGLGVLLSTVGFQAVTGLARFTFGNIYLYDGIAVVTVLMGLFAIPVLMDLYVTEETIALDGLNETNYYRQVFQGAKDVFRHWWLFFRCSVIGYLVGVIPAVGGQTAIWTAYGHAKQTSKNHERFGKGCIEGVIGPESANNAKDGGAMLTTLAFGLPGSSAMVLFLAAFLLMGITPGPSFLREHVALSFAILIGIAFGNILAGVMTFTLAPFLLKTTRIKPVYLFAFTIPLVVIGVYSFRGYLLEVLILVGIGVLGIFLKKFGYSPPAMVLGFALGNYFEYFLWQVINLHTFRSFMSPISIVLIILIVGAICQDALLVKFKNVRHRLTA